MWAQLPEHRRATAWPPGSGPAWAVGPAVSGASTAGTTHTVDVPAAAGGPPGSTPAAGPAAAPMPALAPGTLYRMVAGADQQPRAMAAAEVAALGDPMAAVFFRRGAFPMTLPDLLAGLADAGAVPVQQVFLVSESGQIPPESAPDLPRDIRFAITRAEPGRDPDLLVSTAANRDPATAFLQVAAWDATAGVFNFYMRLTPAWVWAGDSWHALAPDTRGQGCFDSHVNGSVVMKELRQPWPHWQSMAATIALAPGDPLAHHPLYREVAGAELLEPTVKALVSRWTAARLATVTAGGTVRHPDRLLRHLFTTTTVNLTSSLTATETITPTSADLVLPIGFWLNDDALLNDLGLPVTATAPAAPARHYLDSLTRFGFRLQERASQFSQPGDTFFAFAVPEAAYEDNDVVRQMVGRGLLPAKFVACALAVDFPNPVFSPARARLMRYVPTGPTLAAELATRIADAVTSAAAQLPPESPEGQFAANWGLTDTQWPAVLAARVDGYLGRVAARIRTADGFSDYVRLAESRRRQFRAMRLNEFALTLPVTDIPADAPPLRMHEDATVSAQGAPS